MTGSNEGREELQVVRGGATGTLGRETNEADNAALLHSQRDKINREVFDQMKFLFDGMLDYNSKFCKYMLRNQLFLEEKQRRNRWSTYRAHIPKILSTKRNNVTKQMKRVYKAGKKQKDGPNGGGGESSEDDIAGTCN